jgi:hypothetical protein
VPLQLETVMKIGRNTILAAAMLACVPALAQTDAPSTPRNTTVFKCSGADGSVIFSESPCSADPSKVQEVDTSRALLTGSGGGQGDVAAGLADDECRRLAHRSAFATVDADIETSNRHIADYQQRQSQLAEQKVYAPVGSGQILSDPAAPQAIADIDVSIAKEREFQKKARANAEIAYQNAAKNCDVRAARKTQDAQQ